MESTFGQWIRRRRRLLDLTQKELAAQVGCSPVTIRKLEADERRASKQFVERLAQCLAIPTAEYAQFVAYARAVPSFEPGAAPLQLDNLSTGLLSPPTPNRVDWGDAPDTSVFHDRALELAQLQEWLLVDHCRLIAILGMGGIGKTSLATKVAHLLQEQFEVVIWRSLRTAPPVEDILDEFLRAITPDTVLDSVPKLARQLQLLLDHLRRRRCLLVLDNAEAVVAEGEHAGKYRAGFAGYGELLRCVGESSHQSCLLITSREALHELPMLQGVDRPVRVLHLSSLSHAGSCALLAHKGLSGKQQSWAALTSWYSGNPLVLQLVGETIRELFQGDIDRFLQHERALFSGVRELLAGQFARLTPLERDVVVWLALHCGPVAPDVLAIEIEPAPSWAALLDALHSLRKRSMVEQAERGIMLQNVVMEFVTVYFVERLTQEVGDHEDLSQTAMSKEQPHLKHFALLNTQERQHVRDSQTRLVLEPVVERLVSTFGKSGTVERLRSVLSGLRQDRTHRPDYSAGNVLNLLIHLNGHLRGEDFSGLTVRHAALQGVQAQHTKFRATHLDKCDFSLAFNTVLSVAFSPTGDHLAIGSDTGLFCMRRVRSEFPLSRLMTPSRVVWATCFSPDGSLIAGAGIDGTVRIWTTESGRCLQSLTGHIGAVWALCFSPDGKLLASGGADGTIRYWDVQSGHCPAVLAEHTQGVRGLCFSPSGGILASAGEDGTVRLWAGQPMPEQMRCVQILQEHSGMAWAVDFSPDGAHLASGGHDRTIRLYDAQSGRLLKTLAGHTHYITQVCFRSDSSLLASSSYDGTVRLWDPGNGQCVHTLQGHSAHVWAAVFSPAGNVLASGGEDLSVRLWGVAGAGGSGQCLKTLRGYTNSLYATSFSPDGSLVAGGGHDLLVRLWDPLTGHCLAALPGHTSSIWDVNFSPDGRLLVSAGHDRIARVWDVASGRCVYEIETVEGCHATSFHPSARILATANLDGTLDVWDVHNWNLITTLRGHAAEVWAISFSPDGRLVASGSMDNSVRLWDWHSGQCLQTLDGHTSYVRAVKFSPDGALLASSSWDGTVRLWDVRHMPERAAGIAILPGPQRAGQMSVTVSPDGRLLASAGMDSTVCLWHMEDALAGSSPAYVLDGHAGPVYSVGFRLDGHLLASSSEDGTIRLWDVSDARRHVSCVQVLRVERPYARMDITGVTGLTQAQIASLRTLGAMEDEHLKPGTQS